MLIKFNIFHSREEINFIHQVKSCSLHALKTTWTFLHSIGTCMYATLLRAVVLGLAILHFREEALKVKNRGSCPNFSAHCACFPLKLRHHIPVSTSNRIMTSQNQLEPNPASSLQTSISFTSPRGIPSSLLKCILKQLLLIP